jgi:hypothetical protein
MGNLKSISEARLALTYCCLSALYGNPVNLAGAIAFQGFDATKTVLQYVIFHPSAGSKRNTIKKELRI